MAGNRNIRIDNPRDIEFEIDPFSSRKPTKSNAQRQIPSLQEQAPSLKGQLPGLKAGAEEEKWLGEGRSLISSQDYVGAYVVYKGALKKTTLPSYRCKFLVNLGIVCANLNLIQEYQECIKEAARLDTKNIKVIYHQVKVLVRLG